MTTTDGLPKAFDRMRRIHVPGRFEMENAGVFIESPHLGELGDELIAKHEDLAWLEDYRIAYLWKDAGGQKGGMAQLGKLTLASGLTAFFADRDYIIWLAADHVRQMEMSDTQIEALLFHELSHCARSVDKNGEITLGTKSHDMEIFFAEVERYGLWRESLERASAVFQQALPGIES